MLHAGYDHDRPLAGLLRFMVREEFFSEALLREALLGLEREDLDDLPDEVRRVADIVWAIKATGDE